MLVLWVTDVDTDDTLIYSIERNVGDVASAFFTIDSASASYRSAVAVWI